MSIENRKRLGMVLFVAVALLLLPIKKHNGVLFCSCGWGAGQVFVLSFFGIPFVIALILWRGLLVRWRENCIVHMDSYPPWFFVLGGTGFLLYVFWLFVGYVRHPTLILFLPYILMLWMSFDALRLFIVKWERAGTEYELVLDGVVLESGGKGRTVGKKEGGR